jgi:hypothetical protein
MTKPWLLFVVVVVKAVRTSKQQNDINNTTMMCAINLNSTMTDAHVPQLGN